MQLVRRIGASKYATVSECQTAEGRRVAVKQIDKHAVSAFIRERILESASAWRSLTHPGLVAIHSVDPQSGQIVMDLMEQSIETRIREAYGDAKSVLYVLRGLLYALAFFHQRGLVHANIKPSNVFLDGDGRIRLSDGYLYSLASPSTLPAPTNQKYLTPEHTSDAFGGMSLRTDLYAAGFLALELFAGDRFGRGFQGIGDDASESDHAWFQWHGSALVAPDATAFYKACPPELASVIARLVAKNPADRFDSAQEALNALPESLVADHKPAVTPVAPVVEAKHIPSPSDILDRPVNGIVLIIASGPRASEMIGTDDMEFAIGYEPDCLLRFSDDDYPGNHARVACQRTPQGWSISRVRGHNVFLNQHLLDEKLLLRAGDIIRLGPRGPDVQFNLQNAGFSLKAVVSKYASASAALHRPNAPAPPKTPARVALPTGPAPMRPAQPEPARAGAAPARAAPVAGQHPTIAPAAPSAQPQGTRAAASVAPTRPQPLNATKEAKAPSPNTSRQPLIASQPKSASVGQGTKFSLNPKEWTKNQKNLVITVVGVILIVIAVILTPSEQPTKSAVGNATTAEKSSEKSGGATSETPPSNETLEKP